MEPGEIDPVRYGVLWERVQSMDKKVDKMERQIEELLALANKGKGGFWMGMTIASSVGAAVAWIGNHFRGG
jgi:predicted site-specific integrase-resolvase